MIDRQRLQNRAALAGDVVGLEEGVALQHVGDQIAVGQHRALGHAGGATGVLQHREVILIQNDGSIRRFGALVEYAIQFEGTGNRKRRHHFFNVFDEKVDQRALGLGV